MLYFLLILLQYNLSESWKQNYLLYLPQAGEQHGAEGEMTPVASSGQGSDYFLTQPRTSPSDHLSCKYKQQTTVKRKGWKYMMKCSIDETTFEKCQFRKIELTTHKI